MNKLILTFKNKKKMKNLKAILISSILLVFIVTGCKKFYKEDLRGKVIGNSVVDNQTGLESVLTGAYKGLGQTWTMGLLHGAQVHATVGGDDRTGPVTEQACRECDLFTVSSSKTILKELFVRCFKTMQVTDNVDTNYSTAPGETSSVNIKEWEHCF